MKYFDYAATTPLDQEAGQIYLRAASHYFGNSQSLHDEGSAAGNLLENCREEFSHMLGIPAAGIFFTSGGSEANILGILALLSALKKKGNHIITGAAEHSSIFNLMKKLERDGWDITYLPLNEKGQIDLVDVRGAICEDTVLVSLQHGNPEIGSLQPIDEISQFCRSKDILLHSDCVQTFGKLPLDKIANSVDALSISGHKFYGPKGVGVAYVNPKLPWKPLLPGTSHEKGFRPGTVDVPGIAAMTAAAQKVHNNMLAEMERLAELRKTFIEAATHPRIKIFEANGDGQLPGIIGAAIKGIEGQYAMLECNRKGFAISTGTACQIGMHEPSRTMTAMGFAGKEAKEFLRISFGKDTCAEDTRQLGLLLSELAMNHPAV